MCSTMSSTSLTIEQRLDRLYTRSQANGSTTSHDPHSGILDWRPAKSPAPTPAPPLLKKARHRPRTPPKTVDEEAITKLKRADDDQITKIFAEMNDLGGAALSPVVVHAGCARSRQFVPSLQKTTFEQALKVAQSTRQRVDNDDDSSGLDDTDDEGATAPLTSAVGGTVCAPLPEEMPVKTSPGRTSPDLQKASSSVPMDVDETQNDEWRRHDRTQEKRSTSPRREPSPRACRSDERRPSPERRRDDERRRERRLSSRRSSSDWRYEERHRHRSRSPQRSRRHSPERRKSEPDLPPVPRRQREPASSSAKVACSPSAVASSAASPSLGAAMESPTVGQSNQSALVQQSAKWKDAVKLKRLADKMKKEAPLSDGWRKRQEMYMSAGLKFLEAAEMFSCAHSFQQTASFFQNIVQSYASSGWQFFTSIGYECCAVALYRATQVKRKDFAFQTNQLLAHIRSYQTRAAADHAEPVSEQLTFPARLGEMLTSYLKHSKNVWDYMDYWDKAKAYRPTAEILNKHKLEVLESLDNIDMIKFMDHVRKALSSSFTL